MHFIDTHTHLYSESFDEDRKEVISRAQEQHVTTFVLPAIDSSYSQRMDDLKADYPETVHLMNGLHPTHVKPDTYKAELDHVAQRLKKSSFVAVGEIGIDLHWDQSTLEIQKEAFRTQIKWAKTHNLPIAIHCRDAFEETFEILEQERDEKLRGVFHCFTGTQKYAEQAINLNLKLGIGGVVTFKNGKIDRFLDKIPLEQLVLETDAPYLAPTPFRGKRNESAYLLNIAKKVAHIYDIPLEEVATVTNKTARALFRID